MRGLRDAECYLTSRARFAWADAWEGDHIVCHHASDFDLTSELLIVDGQLEPGGRPGKHYFRWHNGEFTQVYFDPECSM